MSDKGKAVEIESVDEALGEGVMNFLNNNDVPFVADENGIELDMSSLNESQLVELLGLLDTKKD